MVKISKERACQLRKTVSYRRFKGLAAKSKEIFQDLRHIKRADEDRAIGRLLEAVYFELDQVHAFRSRWQSGVAQESLQLVLQEMEAE